MTATINLVALSHSTILISELVTLESAKRTIGRTVRMPTLQANETANYKIDSVSRNRETGDIIAWVVQNGNNGHHARLVSSR